MKVLIALSVLFALSSAQAMTKRVWVCKTDDKKALSIIYTDNSEARAKYRSDHVLAIHDDRIADVLRIRPGYVGGAHYGDSFWSQFLGFDTNVFYHSLKGKSEDGVAFYREGDGFKLARLMTGSQSGIAKNLHWYFHASDCRYQK